MDDPALRRRLTAAVRKLETGKAERDALIREMRKEGYTLQAIADLAHLTHAGVLKIINR